MEPCWYSADCHDACVIREDMPGQDDVASPAVDAVVRFKVHPAHHVRRLHEHVGDGILLEHADVEAWQVCPQSLQVGRVD